MGAGTNDGFSPRAGSAILVRMNDHHPSQSSFAPGGYGQPGPYEQPGYAAAAFPQAGYPPVGGYGEPGYGLPGGFPPGMYPPGYNPWLGTFAGPRYASVWRRIGAFLIDSIIFQIIWQFISIALSGIVGSTLFSTDVSTQLTATLAMLILYFVLYAVYIVSQEATWGQTIGKRALGIKVVKADGGEMDVDAALIRYVFLFFYWVGVFGLVTLLTIALSDTKQRLGDRAAGTIVVRAG